MAKLYDSIIPELQQFIGEQPLFFVASAPLDAAGHVNLSPKGLDCFQILSPTRVAYLFCAFGGPPNILRLYGRGRVVLPGSAEWPDLLSRFPTYPGTRQIVVADIERVQTSCGFAVPRMDYVGQRDTLLRWADARGEAALEQYREEKNRVSIDGLPTPTC
jgi:hypothetical protein